MVRMTVETGRMSLTPAETSSVPLASSSVTMATAPTPPTSVTAETSVVMGLMRNSVTSTSV